MAGSTNLGKIDLYTAFSLAVRLFSVIVVLLRLTRGLIRDIIELSSIRTEDEHEPNTEEEGCHS